MFIKKILKYVNYRLLQDCSGSSLRLNVSGQVGGVGGRDEVWDQEMMFSQLAKQSLCVVVCR